MKTISTFPHLEVVNMQYYEDASFQFFNDTGGNTIVVSQGNFNDVDKSAELETVEVTEDVGKIVDIVGHKAKYLFLSITGDGDLEVEIFNKRKI